LLIPVLWEYRRVNPGVKRLSALTRFGAEAGQPVIHYLAILR